MTSIDGTETPTSRWMLPLTGGSAAEPCCDPTPTDAEPCCPPASIVPEPCCTSGPADAEACCGEEDCAPGTDPRAGLSRRGFLGVSGAALAALGLPAGAAAAVPGNKRLDRRLLDSLARRGVPTTYSGEALQRIGMPVGGACAGHVSLAGDGRLWLWDIFNPPASPYGGTDWQGLHYPDPLAVQSPFRTGFAVRCSSGGRTSTRSLDHEGFGQVEFQARYPVGRVEYRDSDSPVEVTLDAFSPFVPTSVDDSSLPATILEYTVRNTSSSPVAAELLGMAEHPVALTSRRQQPMTLRAESFSLSSGAGVRHTVAEEDGADPDHPDIVFEDWERDDYEGWTATGTAFGAGPVRVDEVPGYMLRGGNLGVTGDRFVTSHHFRAGGDIPSADEHAGRLVSEEFTITRSAVLVRIGGGAHDGRTCLNVLVDGEVVATATGANSEVMQLRQLDVSEHRGRTATIEIVDGGGGAWAHVNVDRIVFADRPEPRPDIPFEDWERTDFSGWNVTGTAFGTGPVTEAEAPDYFRREGGLNVTGRRFVTSHNWRGGPGSPAPDDHKGRLTSAPFTIERRYVAVNVGGGNHPGLTCVNVVVDGDVVASFAGRNSEIMSVQAVDVSGHEGSTATVEIVDEAVGGWGHVNVDRIWFTDVPLSQAPLEELSDVGSFTIAALHPEARSRPSIARWERPEDWFDAADAPAQVDGGRGRLASTTTVPVHLEPGRSATVRFALTWHFPTLSRAMFGALEGASRLRRHYGERFRDARAVAEHLAVEGDRLSSATHAFTRTWFDDSTLPHWFLERTLIPASTAATSTCYRFQDGRFYAWEGVYCCEGTCTHVWNYAQSLGRLLPGLERDTRERVDFGIAFHEDTGAIDYRGEFARHVAHDGQCGNILRTYREHQMAPDAAFLRRVWPRVKKATEYLIGHDGEPDGILEAEQYNTLDASWYGEIPWISGLYVAALRAAAEMADDVDDRPFAARCRLLAEMGSDYLDDRLWNPTHGYYEQNVDPDHAGAINSNRGCHLDQMFGQTYAMQLGLPRVFGEEKSTTALRSMFRFNFLPDAQAYKDESGIPGGRVFSTEDEAGTLLCTWPYGGSDTASGDGEPFAIGYFNEVWTGIEYQFAAQLMAEGMVDEALTVTRAVHDRYRAEKRNPYNEIECSDHYARAMMSHAVYLAATGYEYHGPRGHLGFAPRIGPDDFAAAFTVAEGWGRYAQRRRGARQDCTVELRHGRLRLTRFTTVLAQTPRAGRPVVHVDVVDGSGHRRRLEARFELSGQRLVVTPGRAVTLEAGESLVVTALT